MKRYILLGTALALGTLACQQVTPPQGFCAEAPVRVTTAAEPVVVSSKFKPLAPADIDAVESTRILADKTDLVAGSLVASNCNDGLLRKVKSVGVATAGAVVRPQDFNKVYIETETVPLEDVISAGDVSADYGDLNFAEASSMQLQSGVTLQATTGTLQIANKTFNPIPGVSIALNGSLESKLQPKFRLKFAGGKVDVFEIGLTGSLGVNLEGKIQATLAADKTQELEVAKFEFKRAFFIGVVPVVVVVTPRLLVGYNLNVTGDVNVTAKANPTLNMGYGLKYVAKDVTKWQKAPVAPSITFNPTIAYTNQITGSAGVYAKLVMGVKFYGVAGPDLTAESKISLVLNSSGTPLAKLFFGSSAQGSLALGFNVLGVDLNTDLGTVNMFSQSTGFNCTATTCTAL